MARTGIIVKLVDNSPGTLRDTDTGVIVPFGTAAPFGFSAGRPLVGDVVQWQPMYAFNGDDFHGPVGRIEPL